jgi:hypothetical protein
MFGHVVLPIECFVASRASERARRNMLTFNVAHELCFTGEGPGVFAVLPVAVETAVAITEIGNV